MAEQVELDLRLGARGSHGDRVPGRCCGTGGTEVENEHVAARSIERFERTVLFAAGQFSIVAYGDDGESGDG